MVITVYLHVQCSLMLYYTRNNLGYLIDYCGYNIANGEMCWNSKLFEAKFVSVAAF